MYPQTQIKKLIITLCILSALCGSKFLNAKSPSATKEIYYELIIDFGNDFTFIHETTKSEEHCRFRAIVISIKENAKVYCVKRSG